MSDSDTDPLVNALTLTTVLLSQAEARNHVLKSQLGVLGGLSADRALAIAGAGPSAEELAEQAFIREAAQNMGLDEEAFNEEALVISASTVRNTSNFVA